MREWLEMYTQNIVGWRTMAAFARCGKKISHARFSNEEGDAKIFIYVAISPNRDEPFIVAKGLCMAFTNVIGEMILFVLFFLNLFGSLFLLSLLGFLLF